MNDLFNLGDEPILLPGGDITNNRLFVASTIDDNRADFADCSHDTFSSDIHGPSSRVDNQTVDRIIPDDR